MMEIFSLLNSSTQGCVDVVESSFIFASRNMRIVSSRLKIFSPLPAFLLTPFSFFLTRLRLQTILTVNPAISKIRFGSTSGSKRSKTLCLF
uniref:Uncharacterized protein n=1 Tax=Lepeophtheirus salmonis TaxID=72036 RepID=A0A0K2TR97_LEPSM